jgi:hypothetical protein
VWLPDAETNALRRQVLRRAHIVRQRTLWGFRTWLRVLSWASMRFAGIR